jgi:hypothetical protein
MNDQLLFPPASRESHPETSKIAEAKITKSGKRLTHCELVLESLIQMDGQTTPEITDNLSGTLTHPQVWKRTGDLKNNDLVTCNEDITVGGFCTWWITEKGREYINATDSR